MTNTILGFLPQRMYAPEGAPAPTPAQAPQSTTQDDGLKETENFEDEEIVVPDGDEHGETAETVAEPAAAAPPERKKRGPKRYAALTRERDEARSFAEQVARENEALRRETAAANAKAAESDTVAMQTFEAKAKADLAAAKRAHSEALSSNDADKITDAAEVLASARSTMDDVESFKRQKPVAASPAAPAAPAAQAQPQQQPDLPPEIKDWMTNPDNRWFDIVERDSNGNPIVNRSTGRVEKNPDFDEDMHAEAVFFSSNLERKIARGQVKFKVASPEYFAEVEKHIRQEFPDYFEGGDDDESPAPAPQRRGSPVAAPGNRNLPGAASKNGAKSYKLTADEVRFITKSHQNGGGAKYPKGHAKQFQPMSLEDAKVSFARRKMTQAKEQQ